MARVLIVEDDDALATLLDYNFARQGHTVFLAPDLEEARLILAEQEPELVVLDWMLPDGSGLEFCRQIRAAAATRALPVIMLTARGEEEDRIRGLEIGADDYLTKPFSVNELMARARAVLRRSSPGVSGEVMAAGDISLDRESRRVRRADRDVHLGPTEFRLLETLIARPGRVYAREHLLDLVWGHSAEVEARTVDVHIGRLRKALNLPGERDPIRTVRAAGYAFDETYAG